MNYWIGVIGTPLTYRRFTIEKDFWFCMPKECCKGDLVAMYASQRMAKDDGGIFNIYEISGVDECKDGKCRAYGARSGSGEKPIYVDMKLHQQIDAPITFKSLKSLPRLSSSQFMRRNMQATYFKITKAEFEAIQTLLS